MTEWRDELKRIARFFCVALVCTALDALTGLLALNALGLPLTASVVAGFACGLVTAYVLHKRWTFRQEGKQAQGSGTRFFVSNMLLLGARIAFVWLCGRALGLAGVEVTKMIESGLYIGMLGFSFVVNYLFCRLWVFRTGSPPGSSA